MFKYLFLLLSACAVFTAMAQTNDSLFATHKGPSLTIKYTVKAGETLHMLAYRFNVSDGVIENANEPDILKKFVAGAVVNIPITKENYYSTKQTFSNVQELYYRVVLKDDISLISTYAGVTKSQMRLWNNLHGNTLGESQVLFIGWVKMITLDTSNPATQAAYPVYKKRIVRDSVKARIPGNLDTAYNRQTNNGANVLTEKGSAVFFDKPGKNSTYYAFHNTSPRGSVIKVYNPSTGKTIYVKVLGTIPDTKLYSGSIIGICNFAKEALGVTDNKAWCELSYSPN